MQQRNKRCFAVLLAAFMAFAVTACHKQKIVTVPVNDIEPVQGKIRIGFSIDTLALERWQRDLDVFINRVRELGAEVIVQNAGNSVDEQNKQLLYLMERKVDTVVVVAKKRDSLTESIQKLRAKNIPVISYVRLISNADISMYISVNTEKVGELMARQLISQNAGPRWACILGPDEDFNMALLKKGLRKTITGSPYHIGSTFYTEGWNYDLSYQEAVNIFTSGRIPDAIVCGNDAIAGSVIQALLDYCPDRRVPVCGQDADIAACQNVVGGLQSFTVYKPISRLARTAADYAVKLAEGKSVKDIVPDSSTINNGFADVPVVWLEPQLVTKQNIDAVIIDSGFHTYGEVYRDSN